MITCLLFGRRGRPQTHFTVLWSTKIPWRTPRNYFCGDMCNVYLTPGIDGLRDVRQRSALSYQRPTWSAGIRTGDTQRCEKLSWYWSSSIGDMPSFTKWQKTPWSQLCFRCHSNKIDSVDLWALTRSTWTQEKRHRFRRIRCKQLIHKVTTKYRKNVFQLGWYLHRPHLFHNKYIVGYEITAIVGKLRPGTPSS